MATKKFKQEFRARTVGFIATALGLVVGLAWNDAVKTFIETIFPIKGDTILLKFFYAVILTFIVVSVIILLMRFVEDEGDKK
ncbi:MAG TPA: DUF5654 family protein [Candidatus Paceibacterota bacterium]|nr:DUF5654 family protein [Candidatus Paceibacterota bacterium]